MTLLKIYPSHGAIVLKQGRQSIVVSPAQLDSMIQTLRDVAAEAEAFEEERERQLKSLAAWDHDRRGFYSWQGHQLSEKRKP